MCQGKVAKGYLMCREKEQYNSEYKKKETLLTVYSCHFPPYLAKILFNQKMA